MSTIGLQSTIISAAPHRCLAAHSTAALSQSSTILPRNTGSKYTANPAPEASHDHRLSTNSLDRSDQSRQRAKVRNSIIRFASLVSSAMNDDANHSDSLRSLDISPGIIAYVDTGFRLHSEFLCDESERLVAGLDPRRVFTRDYNCFE